MEKDVLLELCAGAFGSIQREKYILLQEKLNTSRCNEDSKKINDIMSKIYRTNEIELDFNLLTAEINKISAKYS